MKNRTLAATATTLLGVMAFDAAAQSSTFGDVARVIAAAPIYEQVSTPRRECHMEQVTMNEVRPTTPPPAPPPPDTPAIGPGTVLGAIVGGVIGHQMGSSSGGRDRGTAVGAVVGGLVGNTVDRDAAARGAQDALPPPTTERVPVTREVQRCSDVMDSREVVVGYDVRYEYAGREFRTRMPQDPGPQMPVNVEVRPPMARPVSEGPRPPVYRGS